MKPPLPRMPGSYQNVPMREYLSWDFASSSSLREFAKNPAVYKWGLDNPEPEATLPPTLAGGAMALGTAIHALLLEPERFDDECVALPELDFRKADDKERWFSIRDSNPGKTFLRPELFSKAEAIATAAKKNETVGQLLAANGRQELSVIHEMQGVDGEMVPVKARIDLLVESPDLNLVVDIKTTSSGGSSDEFARTISNFNYHWQAGLYSLVCRERSDLPDPQGFVYVVIETTEPYLPEKVATYLLDKNEIAQGEEEIRKTLSRHARCVAEDVWPGHATGIKPISRPAWAWRKDEE